MDVGGPGGGLDLLVCRVGPAVSDIVSSASAEEHSVLGHDADLVSQRLEPELADVMAVDSHHPTCRVVQARDQAEHGGLAGSGGTDERDRLAVLDREGDALQDRRSRSVRELDPLEPHLATEGRRHPATLPHLRDLGEHRGNSLGAAGSLARPLGCARDPTQWPVEVVHVRQKDDQLAGRKPTRDDLGGAKPERRRRGSRDRQLDGAIQPCFKTGRPQPAREAPPIQAPQALLLLLLAREYLNDMDSTQHLLEPGSHFTFPSTLFSRRLANLGRVEREEHEEDRRHEGRDDREAPLHREHHGHVAEHDHRFGYERQQARDQELSQHVDVARQPGQQIPCAVPRVKAERQPLEMREELHPHLEHDLLPDPRR